MTNAAWTSPSPSKLLAHELGHNLFPGHGNGLDDNGDGRPAGMTGRAATTISATRAGSRHRATPCWPRTSAALTRAA